MSENIEITKEARECAEKELRKFSIRGFYISDAIGLEVQLALNSECEKVLREAADVVIKNALQSLRKKSQSEVAAEILSLIHPAPAEKKEGV